jgi:hypothetical protein
MANVEGWSNCGVDNAETQTLVNLLALRQIDIKKVNGVEIVTLHYGYSEKPVALNAEHSRNFLISAGLRQVESIIQVAPKPRLQGV